MIQTFTTAFKSYFKNTSKINYVITIIFILFFTFFFFKSGYVNENNLKDVTTNVFPFSSIFSAILITFIISKIFQIRNEKIEVKRKVIVLSNKVTNFRRICDKILSNYDVWDSKTKSKLDNQYKQLKYQHLYDDFLKEKPKQLIENFIADKDLKGAYFYLALRDIARTTNNRFHLELYGEHDEDIIYPIENIRNWIGVDCANAFFYYLEHKYNSYKSSILIDNLTDDEKHEILNSATKINRDKYQGLAFSKELLVKIGNDFQIEYFPKLLGLLSQLNENFSQSLIYVLNLLYIIIIFGVFFPLMIFSFNINFELKRILVYISILFISSSFINFILDFRKILQKEINLN